MFAKDDNQITAQVSDEPKLTLMQKPELSDKEKAERRRRFYERIAQGNALAEVEEQARLQWQQSW